MSRPVGIGPRLSKLGSFSLLTINQARWQAPVVQEQGRKMDVLAAARGRGGRKGFLREG